MWIPMPKTIRPDSRPFRSGGGGLFALCLLLSLAFPGVAAGELPPGLRVGGLLDPFMPSTPAPRYSLSVSSKGLFERRFNPVTLKGTVFGSDPYRLLLYAEVAGARYGVPIAVDLADYIDARLKRDRRRAFEDYLADPKKRSEEADRGGGLLSIQIPVKIPRGLSAITGEGTTQIEITGRRSITFSGRSDYTVGQVQTAVNR
jgi:hypothetical protein